MPDTRLRFNQTVPDDYLLMVKGNQDPQVIAQSIAYMFQKSDEVVVRSIGASSVNQAVKGVAIARGIVAQRGVDLVARVGFTDVEVPDGTFTAMVFRLTLV